MISNKNNKKNFIEGMRDGVPIMLGYFAVSFSLGIMAKRAGLNAVQGFLASFFNNASAGEYAGFTLIAAASTYIEIAIMTFITNARYLLMSTSLSQHISPDLSLFHRMLIAFDVTDELYAISINRAGVLNPFYCYGAYLVALPGWSVGTALGIVAGDIMPQNLVSAFSVALYGMFIACVIPKARENIVVRCTIICCFVLSYFVNRLEIFSNISEGTKIILLTVIISAVVAFLFPRKEEDDES